MGIFYFLALLHGFKHNFLDEKESHHSLLVNEPGTMGHRSDVSV